jgi:hypothetical protein
MRKLMYTMLVFALFVSYSFGDENSDYYEDSYARMSYVKGDVFIQRSEDLGYEEGVVNLALIQGDKIGTREGLAEIHLGEGNYIRIDRNTQIQLVKMPNRIEEVTGMHLLLGNVFLRINFLGNEKFIEVHTSDASFYILEQGLYYLSVGQNNQTELRVFEGRAEAAGEKDSLLLKAEERLIVSQGHFISGPTYFHEIMNSSFVEWNSSRDAFHARVAVESNYLPEELNEYESELAYYGQWNYHNRYGYVWIPSGVSISWRPYYNGRWVWYPIIGWTWVSYEPWGWCVSHYGRWHWSMSLGWYWIPTRRWGPAWVHWYHGPHHIGWCPLSYYGYPGVVINNHYYGNYYHNYYPSGSRALTVVQKNQLQARNVSKVALNKSGVSRLSRISMSSVQPKIKPAVNRTGIRASEAAQVFSKTDVRKVTKAYSASHVLKSSSRSAVPTARKLSTVKLDSNALKRETKATNTESSKTGIRRPYPSRSSGTVTARKALTERKISDTGRASDIRTYPSREIRNVTRSSSPSDFTSRSSGIRRSSTSTSVRSVPSRQTHQIKRYPSRSPSSRSRLSSPQNINSTSRRSLPLSISRNTSFSSQRSSARNRSLTRSSSLIKSQSINRSSSRISTSRGRITSPSSYRVSSRAKIRSSTPKVRSSSSRVSRSSSSVRSGSSSRAKSSSRSHSTARVKKK